MKRRIRKPAGQAMSEYRDLTLKDVCSATASMIDPRRPYEPATGETAERAHP